MRLRLLTAIGLGTVAIVLSAGLAHADDSLTTTNDGVVAEIRKQRRQEQPRSRPRSGDEVSAVARYTYLPKSEYKTQMDDYQQKLNAAIAVNRARAVQQGQCLAGNGACGAFTLAVPPDAPNIREAADPADPAQPVAAPALTPEQMAYIASARISLTPPKPVIGPPPEINEWKMAAVGYPLWLWAEGNLDPAPVADSVLDIAVGLDARIERVVFDMGDGHKVTCSSLTTRWTRAVTPGAKSPTCGYAYPKPSLPAGSYTVTANAVWAIDWNINGTTGTIPFYQSASTQIPVGELQVLVR